MKKSSVICLLAFLLIGCRSAGKQAADAVPVSAPPPQQAYAATLFRATLDSGDSGRLQFAMAALALNERVGEANERLREAYAALLAGNDKLQPSETMTPEHAVLAKWAMRGWLRIHYMFGDWSSFHPGRLAPDVQEKLHELFWNYGCAKSSIRRASAEFIWFIQGSENHDMMDLSNAFLALQAVMNVSGYRDRKLPDGYSAREHVAAWTDYYKLYCEERARRGLFVEISPTYGKYFVPELVNICEFAHDAALRRKMEMLLHLAWADWAIDQLNGTRGGGKTRVYQGHYSQRGSSDSWNLMGRILTGRGGWLQTRHYEAQYVLSLTRYRLPDVVLELALNDAQRGEYVYRSVRPAKLADPPENKPEGVDGYWMDAADPRMVRYSYCTPDFILGSWMLDPETDYAAINTQNRWQGIVFATDENARVFPQCVGLGNGKTYNQHVAAQHMNVAIYQKNRIKSKQAGAMRVCFARGMKERLQRDGPWLFLQEGEAFLAVGFPQRSSDSAAHAWTWQGDNWLIVRDEFAPVVFVAGRASRHRSLQGFMEYVRAHECRIHDGVLEYRFTAPHGEPAALSVSLDDHSRLPVINGREVNLDPATTFDSPFLFSRRGSAVVTIRSGKQNLILDFSTPPAQ